MIKGESLESENQIRRGGERKYFLTEKFIDVVLYKIFKRIWSLGKSWLQYSWFIASIVYQICFYYLTKFQNNNDMSYIIGESCFSLKTM